MIDREEFTVVKACRHGGGSVFLIGMILLFCLVPGLFSQSTEGPPSWILLERGKNSFHDGELGVALFYFRKTLERGDLIADGYTWTGKVYEAEGELVLAEQAYRNAIEHEKSFYVWEERYTPRKLLARVLEREGKQEEAIAVYAEIISMQKKEYPVQEIPDKLLLSNYLEKGPDKFLELYRPEGSQTIPAHAALGTLFMEKGESDAAMGHLLLACTIPLSMTIDLLLSREPGYRFITTSYGYENTLNLLKKGEADDDIALFFEDAGMYESLYHFASLLEQEGAKERALELFTILTYLNGGGRWRLLAEDALAGF